MAAEEGNNYAEKWTEETVLPIVKEIEEYAKEDSCLWLGEALIELNLYKDVWQYWKNKFNEESEVFRTIKRVDQILENRLFKKAIKGETNATLSIFALKNNHGWRDKTETDITSGGDKVNIPPIVWTKESQE